MTFETSLAAFFVALWTMLVIGTAVKELFFKPKFP